MPFNHLSQARYILKSVSLITVVDQVSNVLCKNINQKKRNKVLELLAIKNISMKDQTSKISLIFAGDSIITILVEEIDVLLDDLGEPWIVKKAPKHKI